MIRYIKRHRMINSCGKNGKPFIVNLLEATRKNLTFPFIVGAYRLMDNNSLSNREYVQIVYNDLLSINDCELVLDSCDELQTEIIGLKKEVDADYFSSSLFKRISDTAPMKYNTDIFGDSLTATDLYNRYSECFENNKYSRHANPYWHWGDYTEDEVQKIKEVYAL